ncbi:MAG: homogentisate 1,2-dioxygenase [Proteobacteria bacterium]|nr:homogentisate 1,2-dioxygenase [Pseudomonadota bacterium]
MSDLKYLAGFHNEHVSEATPGAVPQGRNSPQKPPLGLYPEQLNGTAFTMSRSQNFRSWLYRILPSVIHGDFHKIDQPAWLSSTDASTPASPMQLRWNPMAKLTQPKDFLEGIETVAVNGSVDTRSGSAVHHYRCNKSMEGRFFYNADGEMLIVPQSGKLLLKTEFGHLAVSPTEICVIPRGVKFKVDLLDGDATGYICENFGASFELPNLGPIGSNGLASPRDFEYPQACYENLKGNFKLMTKFCGNLWEATIDHSPLNVVGWFGNYAPYKYDLKRFNTINTVSFDHPDPSIFTVLTSPSGTPGQANVDFVIFPPRWMVADDTFRPPYFHRNVMSEFMGLIHGVYDAKPSGGFEPGGSSLHNCMQAHGPEADAFTAATNKELKPEYQGNTLAFMFESCWVYQPTKAAMESPSRQKNYLSCWQGLKETFPKKP